MVNSYKNVVRIKVLAEAFSKLKNKVVFVGGAVVELYCDDPARGEIRPTDDVDVVIEVLNKGSYWELISTDCDTENEEKESTDH